MRRKKPAPPPRPKRAASYRGAPKKRTESVPPPPREAATPEPPMPPVPESSEPAGAVLEASPPELHAVTPTPPPSADPSMSEAELADQIRALEARLDRMIESSKSVMDAPPPSARHLTGSEARAVVEGPERAVFDTARELLSTDFYLRKWGRLGMRNRSEEVDDFGFDPIYDQKVLPFLSFLYDKYFRASVHARW